jgi:hypothetical protein
MFKALNTINLDDAEMLGYEHKRPVWKIKGKTFVVETDPQGNEFTLPTKFEPKLKTIKPQL